MAADRLGNHVKGEENRHTGSVRCQSVGQILHGFLEQQWSQVHSCEARKESQGNVTENLTWIARNANFQEGVFHIVLDW